MKKLLIASVNLDFGGVEKALIGLLKILDPKEYKVTLLLQQKKGVFLSEVPSFIQVKEYKLCTFKIPFFRKIVNRIHLLFYTCCHYRKYDAAVCYATYDIPSALITQKVGKKSILWVHSNYTYIYKKEEELRQFFDTRKVNRFDKIIFVSNEAKQDLIHYYPEIKNKSEAINNLFDFKEIIQKSKENIDIIMPSEKCNLVFVGRLEEKAKAIFRLLQIMEEFMKEGKNYFLWIIGSGEDEEAYQKYAKEHHLSNVRFLGSQKNPYPYMAHSDLIVLPSYYEGFPVTCIEALALQKKVVTTIDVSTGSFSLKDYVFLARQSKDHIKKTIEKAACTQNQDTFDSDAFNKENMEATLKVLNGG